MAAIATIPLPASLKITASNLAAEWKRFRGQWTNYVKAAKVHQEDKDVQAAILLACIGTDAYNIFDAMQFDSENDRQDPNQIIESFERHCVGETNKVY